MALIYGNKRTISISCYTHRLRTKTQKPSCRNEIQKGLGKISCIGQGKYWGPSSFYYVCVYEQKINVVGLIVSMVQVPSTSAELLQKMALHKNP